MLINKEEALVCRRVYFDMNNQPIQAVPVEFIQALPDALPAGQWRFEGYNSYGQPLFHCSGCLHIQVNGGKFCSNCGRRNKTAHKDRKRGKRDG